MTSRITLPLHPGYNARQRKRCVQAFNSRQQRQGKRCALLGAARAQTAEHQRGDDPAAALDRAIEQRAGVIVALLHHGLDTVIEDHAQHAAAILQTIRIVDLRQADCDALDVLFDTGERAAQATLHPAPIAAVEIAVIPLHFDQHVAIPPPTSLRMVLARALLVHPDTLRQITFQTD